MKKIQYSNPCYILCTRQDDDSLLPTLFSWVTDNAPVVYADYDDAAADAEDGQIIVQILIPR